MQAVAFARCLPRFRAGNSRLARIAMIAITTSNSISVKARFGFIRLTPPERRMDARRLIFETIPDKRPGGRPDNVRRQTEVGSGRARRRDGGRGLEGGIRPLPPRQKD